MQLVIFFQPWLNFAAWTRDRRIVCRTLWYILQDRLVLPVRNKTIASMWRRIWLRCYHPWLSFLLGAAVAGSNPASDSFFQKKKKKKPQGSYSISSDGDCLCCCFFSVVTAITNSRQVETSLFTMSGPGQGFISDTAVLKCCVVHTPIIDLSFRFQTIHTIQSLTNSSNTIIIEQVNNVVVVISPLRSVDGRRYSCNPSGSTMVTSDAVVLTGNCRRWCTAWNKMYTACVFFCFWTKIVTMCFSLRKRSHFWHVHKTVSLSCP